MIDNHILVLIFYTDIRKSKWPCESKVNMDSVGDSHRDMMGIRDESGLLFRVLLWYLVMFDKNIIWKHSKIGSVCCRGSQEPRGLKSISVSVNFTVTSVEVRKSLVDWNKLARDLRMGDVGRGSQEPRGLKLFSSMIVTSICVEVRKSLVDWNVQKRYTFTIFYVEVRKSLVDWNADISVYR